MELKFFWAQVRDLTLASLKSRYRKTFAGFIWVVLNPLMMFGVQSLVFKTFMRIQVPDYHLFLLGGLLPWIFFSSTVQMGTPVFVTQSQLLRSFKINPMVILSSQVLDNFINFAASFLLILLPFYISSGKDMTNLLLLPVALIPLLAGTLALCITLGTINVFFRDTNFVLGFVLNLLFYMTPVFYPKDFIPPNWIWIVHLNPAIYLLEPFRSVIYFDGANFGIALLKGTGIAIGLSLIAVMTWKRKRNAFYHKL
ncbi:MAG: ABC transporter permease [Bdellovibrionales bacterium]|nr:ABC transporter permease [Bdellovibrionales bacterium]